MKTSTTVRSPVHTNPDGQEEGKTIGDMAPEILAIIFEFAHCGIEIPQLTEDHSRRLPTYGSLFPYAPAGVCTLWKDVLYTKKKFWTVVVLFVDAQPTSTADVSSILNASGDLPIDVMILSRAEHAISGNDASSEERKRVRDIMEVVSLQRHTARCKTFFIETVYATSLPFFPYDFQYCSDLLKSLKLECSRDDGTEIPDSPELDTDCLDANWSILTIDGINFKRLVAEQPVGFEGVQHLTVAHYSAELRDELDEDEEAEGALTAENLLAFIRVVEDPLESVKFTDLHLPPSVEGMKELYDRSRRYADEDDYRTLTIECPMLSFRDIHRDTLKEMFELCEFTNTRYLEIQNCRINLFTFPIRAATLALRGISGSESGVHDMLDRWEGTRLVLWDCPIVDDDLLYHFLPQTQPGGIIISESTSDVHNWDVACCANMLTLEISGCPDFSMAALKEVFKQRNRFIDYHNPQWREVDHPSPAIQKLTVSGSCADSLSEDDDAWFRAKVPQFSWTGTQQASN